MRVTK